MPSWMSIGSFSLPGDRLVIPRVTSNARPAGAILAGCLSLYLPSMLDSARARFELLGQRDVVRASDVDGHSLVDSGGLDLQNRSIPGRGLAARLLHDHGHGSALVQETQLAVRLPGIPPIGGIEIDPSFDQDPMHVGDEAAAVARRIGTALRFLRSLEVFKESPRGRMVVALLPFVGRIRFSFRGDPDRGLLQEESIPRRIQREKMSAGPGGECEGGGRSIIQIAGRCLQAPLLQ